MKKLVASLVGAVFALALGIVLLSGPSTALAHPGNTCNPPAGHGRSGCHRVTASSTAAARARASARVAAARKAAAAKRARIARAVAAKRAAAARAAAAASAAAAKAAAVASPTIDATTPVGPPSAVSEIQAPVVPAPTPMPWWLAIWKFFVG